MKTILKITTFSAILLILAGGLASCNEKENTATSIAGTWKVTALTINGDLMSIGYPPEGSIFQNITIIIPDASMGKIRGNNFFDTIEFEFEIKENQQIDFNFQLQYIENELIIRLKQGVDAYEFATFHQGIAPKELLAKNWNTWLFETDGTESLDVLINRLSKDDNVIHVSRNNTGITLRSVEDIAFRDAIANTVKFAVSNNELTFMDSRGTSSLVVFTNR